MSKTLLLYERAVPISKTRHVQHSVQPSIDFEFAREVNSLPLLAQEFRAAAWEYPIVFAGNEERVMPAILLGFGEHDNLFVDAEGKWRAQYVPAFARRYPYIFSSVDEGKTLTLCIDEEYRGLNTEDDGERLFSDEGEKTAYLDQVLEFQKEYQLAFRRTQVFCRRIIDLELLEPMQAQVTRKGGEQQSISGFRAVNRDKFKFLKGEQLSELSRTDELELIFLHLHSMQNIVNVANRLRPLDSADQPEKAPPTKKAARKTAAPKTASKKTASKKTASRKTVKKAAKAKKSNGK